MEPLRDDDPAVIGGYTLLGRIGAGGMGQVYLGESVAGQQVAVKVIKPSVLDEEARERFLLEVDSLKTVYGPFVAAFVAADAAADQPWLAVEFVPGPDLRTFVTGHGPLPLVETASLGALLAEGLGTVHEAGLLHRDLKPQNILLASYGPKMIDFGLAVLAERRSSLTMNGAIVGSVQCMPPEQARGKCDEHELGRPADVYALGAVLLYAATGHYPYTGADWHAIAYAVGDPNTPPDLEGLPGELEPVIAAMLRQEAADRPEPHHVIRELVQVVNDHGLSAAQAKRRLAQLVSDAAAQGSGCSPTPGGDAASGEQGIPGQRGAAAPKRAGKREERQTGDAGATSERGEAGSGSEKGDREGGSGSVAVDQTVLPVGSAGASVRPSAPLRIAEQLRRAYAREARF